MNAQTRKEIRAILPFFALTVLAPWLTVPLTKFWPGDTVIALTLFISGIAGVAMSALTFGEEFSNRTMGLLLTQPLSRSKIWRRKMLVLGIAVAVCFLAVGARVFIHLGCHVQTPTFLALGFVLFLTIGIYCTTPFWTMCVQNALGAMAATLLTPIVLMFSTDILMMWFFPQLRWDGESNGESYFLAVVLVLYFGLCYWLGRRTFLRLEVTDLPRREIALPESLQPLFAPLWRALMPGHGSPLRSLITKELYLQRVSFGMAVVFGAVFFFGAASWRLSKSEWATTAATVIMVTSAALNFMLDSVITGGVCVAEERNWGMLGWQLILPPSRRKQWLVKIGIALLVSVVLGVILPIGMFYFCKSLFHLPFDPFTSTLSPLNPGGNNLADKLSGYSMGLMLYLLLTGTAIYASTLTTGTLRAVIVSLSLIIAGCAALPMGAIAGIKLAYVTRIRLELVTQNSNGQLSFDAPSFDPMLLSISLAALLAVLLCLGFVNFRAGEISSRRKWLQPLAVLAGIWMMVFVFCFAARSVFD